jgi:glycosyltransferase involved in cell wall biosynthesis
MCWTKERVSIEAVLPIGNVLRQVEVDVAVVGVTGRIATVAIGNKPIWQQRVDDAGRIRIPIPAPRPAGANKFPAYFLPHRNKRLWLLHQYRQAYDLQDIPFCNIAHDCDGLALRAALQQADTRCLEAIEHRFVNSAVTRDRLKKFSGVSSTVLHPPLNDPELFQAGDWGSYIFCGGRINDAQRQWLVVQAMQHTRSAVRVVIAGPADANSDRLKLEQLVGSSPAADRIEVRVGRLRRQELGSMVSGALACVAAPVDDDSFSYVAMEACEAGKAVLTTTDAGGVRDLVAHRQTGLVCCPEPRAVADALDRLWLARANTIKMGRSAQARWRSFGITWPATIAQLLA